MQRALMISCPLGALSWGLFIALTGQWANGERGVELLAALTGGVSIPFAEGQVDWAGHPPEGLALTGTLAAEFFTFRKATTSERAAPAAVGAFVAAD